MFLHARGASDLTAHERKLHGAVTLAVCNLSLHSQKDSSSSFTYYKVSSSLMITTTLVTFMEMDEGFGVLGKKVCQGQRKGGWVGR